MKPYFKQKEIDLSTNLSKSLICIFYFYNFINKTKKKTKNKYLNTHFLHILYLTTYKAHIFFTKRVTFRYLSSLFKRLLYRLKVLSLIIFIMLISSRLILVLCFFLDSLNWNWGVSYMLSNTEIHLHERVLF